MIVSYDNDSLIFDMHIMIKMISRYYHSNYHPNINKISKYQFSNNNILSRYFDKPQYCTLVGSCERFFGDILLERRPLLVGFLSRYSDIESGSLRSGILCEIDSDLFVFSYQDCFVNMIRTRVESQ